MGLTETSEIPNRKNKIRPTRWCVLREIAACGLGDDVDHSLRSGDQGSVIRIVGMHFRVHAFGHELLGDRVDHPVFLGDEEPRRAVFPPGPGHGLLDAWSGDGPLDRRQHGMLFGSALLGECLAKSVDRQPDPAMIIRLEVRRIGVWGIAVEDIGDGFALVGRQGGDVDQRAHPRMLGGSDDTAGIACPTTTTGPSVLSMVRSSAFTSSERVLSGIGAAITGIPASSRPVITRLQLDPSAQAPWTSTTVGDDDCGLMTAGLSIRCWAIG
jgi:hypothetical protein